MNVFNIDWRTVFERSPLPGMLVHAQSGVCLAINHEAAAWFNVSPEVFVGKSSLELNVWPDPTARDQAIAHTREHGYLRNFEAEVIAQKERRTVLLNMELLDSASLPCLLVNFVDITQRKNLEAQLRQSALHDSVTGLPNRTMLAEHLDHAITLARRHDSKIAILFLDLDHFKAVNDQYGHAAGDLLLKQIAGRLKDSLRASDLASRLGGDEFVIVLEELQNAEQAMLVAKKIIYEMRLPFMAGEHQVSVGASIGVAIYPDHAATPDLLLRYADQALYTSKDQGRNTCHLWQAPLVQT